MLRPVDRVSVDELEDNLLPDVNDLSDTELDEFLDSDSETITRYYFESLARKIGEERRTVGLASREKRKSEVVPKTARALAEHARSEIFTHFRNSSPDTWNAYAWPGTHIPARILREARMAGIAPEHCAYLVDAVFDALEETTREYLGKADAHLDDLWPLLECLEELGSEASCDRTTSGVFVKRYAALAVVQESAALTAGLTWGVNELLERGSSSQRLATEIAHELVRVDPTDRSRSVLAILGRLRPRDRQRLPPQELRGVGKPARDFLRTLLADADRSAKLLSTSFRSATGKLSFEELLPNSFLRFLYLARTGSAFTTVAAMAATKLSLRGVYEPLKNSNARTRSAAVSYLCTLVVSRVAGVERGVAFAACEALEGVRDRFKRECAEAMAAMLPNARPLLRQGMFVFVAEGYEETFRGRRQQRVPEFVDATGRVRFLPRGHIQDLGVFGRRAARLSITHPDLRQQLDWMNERLRSWLPDVDQ